MGKEWFNPREFIMYILGDWAVKKAGFFKEEAGKKVGEVLAAKASGRGSTDELLSLLANVRARSKYASRITDDDLYRLAKILKGFDRETRNKITNIIGHSEQEVVVEKLAPGKGGKLNVVERKVEKNNDNGAAIIAWLVRYDNRQIKEILRAWGALDTFSKNAEEAIRSFFGLVKRLEKEWGLKKKIRKKIIRPLEKWANKNDLRQVMERRERGRQRRRFYDFWSSPENLAAQAEEAEDNFTFE